MKIKGERFTVILGNHADDPNAPSVAFVTPLLNKLLQPLRIGNTLYFGFDLRGINHFDAIVHGQQIRNVEIDVEDWVFAAELNEALVFTIGGQISHKPINPLCYQVEVSSVKESKESAGVTMIRLCYTKGDPSYGGISLCDFQSAAWQE
ncbi:hypothetical protein V5O48_005079 [Marasmius crinis-equi]|uniref:Uncharacterized protein n=1 Tax=Marasmius crinis-equi TaxID=585013 RepID=A0ABR3FP96_9AGAR